MQRRAAYARPAERRQQQTGREKLEVEFPGGRRPLSTSNFQASRGILYAATMDASKEHEESIVYTSQAWLMLTSLWEHVLGRAWGQEHEEGIDLHVAGLAYADVAMSARAPFSFHSLFSPLSPSSLASTSTRRLYMYRVMRVRTHAHT